MYWKGEVPPAPTEAAESVVVSPPPWEEPDDEVAAKEESPDDEVAAPADDEFAEGIAEGEPREKNLQRIIQSRERLLIIFL